MCMKVEVIKNPLFSFLQLKMWYPRGNLFGSLTQWCVTLKIGIMLYAEVRSERYIGETSFQARKYKSNHSHSTGTLSLVVYVQQNVKIQIQ